MSKPEKKPAAATKDKPKVEAPAYVMPEVDLGDVVLWNVGLVEESDAADVPAIVTAVHEESVSLAPLHPGTYNFDPQDGVRHADHPDKDAVRNSAVGCWRHRDSHKKLLARLAAVEDLLGAATRPA